MRDQSAQPGDGDLPVPDGGKGTIADLGWWVRHEYLHLDGLVCGADELSRVGAVHRGDEGCWSDVHVPRHVPCGCGYAGGVGELRRRVTAKVAITHPPSPGTQEL